MVVLYCKLKSNRRISYISPLFVSLCTSSWRCVQIARIISYFLGEFLWEGNADNLSQVFFNFPKFIKFDAAVIFFRVSSVGNTW